MNKGMIFYFTKAAVIVAIAMLIIPLPTWLFDVLMATNILFALLILFIVLCTPRVAKLSLFPPMMLASSVLTLGLNVSCARLILSLGTRFDGHIVRAFSTFVVGTGGMDSLLIGFVIFMIITIIQTVIIMKGTPRIARLALHFMVDTAEQGITTAESQRISGEITEEEASNRKMKMNHELDFYASMNNAVRFYSGIVKIGLFITVINFVAGIICGMVLRCETFDKAVQTYAALAIGNGLIAQLPPILTALAVSLIVIRLIKNSVLDENKNDETKRRFAKNAKIYYICGVTMIIIGLLPGIPWYVLIPLGLAFIYISSQLKYKIVKANATGFLEARNEMWLKTIRLDANITEQIAIDMTGPSYNSLGDYNNHIEILIKGEAEKNGIILKKLSAKWNDIFERKVSFAEISPKNDGHFEKIGNLPDGGFIQIAGSSPNLWHYISSAIKSDRLESTQTSLKYKTKDNKILSIDIKKEAFGAVIVFSFISEESRIKMHIYITPHGAPALPDLREPDIIDAQVNVKLPKNKAIADRITIDDIFAKLGIERIWEKAENFEHEFYKSYRECYKSYNEVFNNNQEEQHEKQIEASKEKVQADIEKLNKTLSELDSI